MRNLLTLVAIAILALLPRVVGLDDFLTYDEAYHWIGRTERFYAALQSQNWADTYQTGHPGVTLMWLGSAGVLLEQWAHNAGWLSDHSIVDHLAWMRLPAALLHALLIAASIPLLRRLLGWRTAIIAALLWATSPFLIAHARVLHLDGLLTDFVTLTILSLLLACQSFSQSRAYKPQMPTNAHRCVVSTTKSHTDSKLCALTDHPTMKRGWLIGAGVWAGLALLTKGPALILLPMVGLLLLWHGLEPDVTAYIHRKEHKEREDSRQMSDVRYIRGIRGFFFWVHTSGILSRLRSIILAYMLWLAVALAVVVLLWPALWVEPLVVLERYGDKISGEGTNPFVNAQFFMGHTVSDPGVFFYPVAIIFRLSPVVLVGIVGMAISTLVCQLNAYMNRKDRTEHKDSRQVSDMTFLFALGACVLFWLLVMTSGSKKFDRYVLPIWPLLIILAAVGWSRVLRVFMLIVAEYLNRKERKERKDQTAGQCDRDSFPESGTTLYSEQQVSHATAQRRKEQAKSPGCFRAYAPIVAITGLLIAATVLPVLAYFPYYLSYYNPLFGGGRVAQRVLLIGWGEGMDQAGAYIRSRPDGAEGVVLATNTRLLEPFVSGPVLHIAELDTTPANYVVLDLPSLQRNLYPQQFARMQQEVPLHRVMIHGIEYAHIYQLPRPFDTPVGAQFGDWLRLHGITMTRQPGLLTITPAWGVRARPPTTDCWVFVHVLDSAGNMVAQVDTPPGGADLPPTHTWSPGQQVAVPLPIPLPDLPAGEYAITMGVYDVQTGQRVPVTEGRLANPAHDGGDAVVVDYVGL